LKFWDRNTKCFHKFVENRKTYNTIWDVLDSEGYIQHKETAIKASSLNFYKSLYKAKVNEYTLTQFNVLKEVPRFFTYEESNEVGKKVTLQEVEKILELMPKDKSPGLDGWTQEIFHHLFDIMGKYLLNATEETRISGKVIGSLNYTFMNLIPKDSKPSSFHEYRQIYLCNFVYKFVTKLITSRIKDKLDLCISNEQFFFLKDMFISYYIGLAQ